MNRSAKDTLSECQRFLILAAKSVLIHNALLRMDFSLRSYAVANFRETASGPMTLRHPSPCLPWPKELNGWTTDAPLAQPKVDTPFHVDGGQTNSMDRR